MARPLAKSPFVLLALGLWILACPASLAEDDDPNALESTSKPTDLNKENIRRRFPLRKERLKWQSALVVQEHPRPPKPSIASGSLPKTLAEYAKAEPLYQEALRIQQKVLGPEHPDTATSLNNLASTVLGIWASTPKPNRSTRKRSGSGRRSWAPNIPTRRPASITWPSCTRRWASTPKPSRSFKKRSGSDRSPWAGTSRHGE